MGSRRSRKRSARRPSPSYSSSADTLHEVTANTMRGANQAAFGQDQLIRGVQTFRNPQTGDTFELRNLHDHAWLGGNNGYLMSDDPNGRLNGNWTSLQPVRPQP
jgi:hypothetical protein